MFVYRSVAKMAVSHMLVLILATDLYKNTVVCYFSYLRLGTRLVSSIVFSYVHVASQNYRLKSQREKCDGIL